MRAAIAFTLVLSGCATPSKDVITPPDNLTPMEKKLADNPNDREINLQFGDEAVAGGDLLRAEQYYLRAEALGVPQDTIVPRIVRVLVASKRYDEALDRCNKRLAAKPGDRATRFVEASLLVALERPKDAERELNALVRTQPKDPEAYLALGKLYRDGNDAEHARVMFEKYLELAPDGRDAAAVRFELAEIPPPAAEKPQP
jgi:tetratricopeptide (TPR) repeat protein